MKKPGKLLKIIIPLLVSTYSGHGKFDVIMLGKESSLFILAIIGIFFKTFFVSTISFKIN